MIKESKKECLTFELHIFILQRKSHFPFVRSSRPCWHLIQSTRGSVCPDKMNMIAAGQRQSTIQNRQRIWPYTSWLGHNPTFFCRSHLMAPENMEHKIFSSSPWKTSKNAVTCSPKRFICATLSSFSCQPFWIFPFFDLWVPLPVPLNAMKRLIGWQKEERILIKNFYYADWS